ncbi:sulfotransferase 2B1-like [Sebastes fasciatus]|uniref:sulfotransferase 2B1-like n=1 Tax=Sebastes fasciatus TaxID=394691 RepID=UPI003D9DB197
MTEAELCTVYKGISIPTSQHTPQSLKYFEEFSFRPDDIIIATYPKSGTTWTQEIVPLIVSGGDPASVETLPNWKRAPWLEKTLNVTLEERPSPRLSTTHMWYNMMPPSFFEVKPKVINVVRNPRDVLTSSFHYYGMAAHLVNPGSKSKFLHKFLDGKVLFGTWFDHVKSWLNAEDKEHVIHISYEEMLMNMKKNNMSNYSTVPESVVMDQTKSEFLRKGLSGDWKNDLTVAEAEYFDAVYKDKMKDVEYKFVWD